MPPQPLTLAQAALAMRAGELSAAGFAGGFLRRIEALEPRLHAFAHMDPRAVEAAAAACDARPAQGPLHGVPVAVKDIIAVSGMPTRMGSPIPSGQLARTSAEVIRRIEAAGGYAMGKTVTAEFAYLAPGPSGNPWNPLHTPGGSSSGSAAAVAAGMAPAALGTQTNGSIIRPAAFCGVVGLKPSRGTVPNHGTLDYSPTLDQTGVFARCVEDAALLAGAIMDSPPPPGRGAGVREAAISQQETVPRLAAVRSPVWHLAEEPMRRAFAAGIETLRRAGATVDEAELPPAFDSAHRVQRCIMAFEAARHFGPLQRRHRDLISRELNAFIDEGSAIAEADYGAAQAERLELERQLERFLAGCEAILTPPARGEAPAGIEATGDPAFCTIWTLTGVPAISLPASLGPKRLPLGLQLVGRRGGDAALLAAAAWCEQALGWRGEPPL